MIPWRMRVNNGLIILTAAFLWLVRETDGFRPMWIQPAGLPKMFSALDVESISRETKKKHESTSVPSMQQGASDAPSTVPRSKKTDGDLPWSDSQQWALQDSLPKYTFQVVLDGQLKRMIRWRTLLNNVVELAGYPIPFVIAQYELSQGEDVLLVSTETLPYLDKFRFETNGGLSGEVFGARGIQDGTRIRTQPVVRVDQSIPLGYVVTDDNSVVYELGEPEQTQGSVAKQVEKTHGRLQSILDVSDPDLIQLGGLTAMVLSGAWAMQTLSHHLTVNIFWV